MKRVFWMVCALLLVAHGAASATFSYLVGDIDDFGGAIADNRSPEEAAATNGAQFTDRWSNGSGYTGFARDFFPVTFRFDLDPFEVITSMTVTVFAFGINGNDNNPEEMNFSEDALAFEGTLIPDFFLDVNQANSGEAFSASLDPSLFPLALDGVAEFSVLLNSFQGTDGPFGETAAFDHFALTVEGALPAPPPPPPAPVPAPAPLLLLPLAVAGLRLVRRRRVA